MVISYARTYSYYYHFGALVSYMTFFKNSKRLNLNTPTHGTQCEVNYILASQRLGKTRH